MSAISQSISSAESPSRSTIVMLFVVMSGIWVHKGNLINAPNLFNDLHGQKWIDAQKWCRHQRVVQCANAALLRIAIAFNFIVQFRWIFFSISDETVRYLVQCGRTMVIPMNSVWYTVWYGKINNFSKQKRIFTNIFLALISIWALEHLEQFFTCFLLDNFYFCSIFYLTKAKRRSMIGTTACSPSYTRPYHRC